MATLDEHVQVEHDLDILLEIVYAGRGINQEIQRNLFVSDSDTAEKLRNRCQMFINALIVASRQFESQQHIMDEVILAVIEFERNIFHLEERFNNFEEEGVNYVCPSEPSSEGKGRPKLLIPKEQLEGLRSLGFSWVSISKLLGVSEKTIRRRREAYDMSSSREVFSEIADDEIDHLLNHVLQISPNSGERMIMGWFRGRGIHVQRWRIRESIWRVDPVGRELRRKTVTKRRVYSVPTPNSLWHLDGHHKLIRWRVVIHGAIDGYSRAVVFMKASTNNKASTVLQLFLSGIQVYRFPRRIRTDYGTENVDVAREMLDRYGSESKPVLTGKSVHNQRIERLWRDVHNYVVLYYKNIFYYLESNELLDPNDDIDLFVLHYIFLPRLNRAIDQFVMQWNNHPLSSERGYTPLQKWTEGFYKFAQSDYSTVRDMMDPRDVNSYYGIDDDAPLPDLQTANHVVVPESTIQLTEAEQTILDSVDALLNDNEHGIVSYETANRLLREIISNR